jgi:hypothetical protein
MNELEDEAMQQKLEKHLAAGTADLPAADNKDLQAYSLLFGALGKEPAIAMTHNFPRKVTAAIQAGRSRASDIKLWLVVAAFLLLLLFTGGYYLNSINSINGSRLLFSLANNKGILIFGLATIMVVQVLDKKLVRQRG